MVNILNIIIILLVIIYLIFINLTYKSEERKFAMVSVVTIVLFFVLMVIKCAIVINSTHMFWKIVLSGLLSSMLSVNLFFTGVFFAILMENKREKNQKYIDKK